MPGLKDFLIEVYLKHFIQYMLVLSGSMKVGQPKLPLRNNGDVFNVTDFTTKLAGSWKKTQASPSAERKGSSYEIRWCQRCQCLLGNYAYVNDRNANWL